MHNLKLICNYFKNGKIMNFTLWFKGDGSENEGLTLMLSAFFSLEIGLSIMLAEEELERIDDHDRGNKNAD